MVKWHIYTLPDDKQVCSVSCVVLLFDNDPNTQLECCPCVHKMCEMGAKEWLHWMSVIWLIHMCCLCVQKNGCIEWVWYDSFICVVYVCKRMAALNEASASYICVSHIYVLYCCVQKNGCIEWASDLLERLKTVYRLCADFESVPNTQIEC